MELLGRERILMENARRTGYLDQRNQSRELVRRQYERWCWAMKIPVVRILRRSPSSRFSRIVLDMYTTPNTLSEEGQEAAAQLCQQASSPPERSVSPFGAEFRRIPNPLAAKFAREIFHIASSLGFYLPDLGLLEARRRTYGQKRSAVAQAAVA
jgi:hypothetical protein